MRRVLVFMGVLLFVVAAAASSRVENSKVVVPDTSVVKVRGDTLLFVVYDTLKIAKSLKDTTIVVKIDTVKSASKPVQVVRTPAPAQPAKAVVPAKK